MTAIRCNANMISVTANRFLYLLRYWTIGLVSYELSKLVWRIKKPVKHDAGGYHIGWK